MEKILGSLLDSEWVSLDPMQKDAITAKLRTIFREMRALPSPGNYCSIENQPLLDGVFWNDNDMQIPLGTFQDRRRFQQRFD